MDKKITEQDKQAIKKRFSKSNFFNLLNLEIKELEYGKAVIAVKPQENLQQSVGLLHGGVTATLCDTAVAVALITMLPVDADIVTIEIKINYLKAVQGKEIFACAEIIKKGNKIAVGDVIVIDDKGEHYAAALSTYAIR